MPSTAKIRKADKRRFDRLRAEFQADRGKPVSEEDFVAILLTFAESRISALAAMGLRRE